MSRSFGDRDAAAPTGASGAEWHSAEGHPAGAFSWPVAWDAKRLTGKLLGSEIRPTKLRVILKSAKHARRALGDCAYDFWRYFRYSSTFHYETRDNLSARLTAICHNVERGLALPEPRPGFGAENMAYLLKVIEEYIGRYGLDSSLDPAAGALDAYLKFNERVGLANCPHRREIERVLLRLQPVRSGEPGGTISVSREGIRRATEGVGVEFFLTRHSIRQFSNAEVDAADIDAAIQIAQRAPAVCNRQESRAHVVHDKHLILEMLALQGSRGFNEQVNKLVVVTTKLTAFWGSEERNQCWIDGGLFAMSLVLGFHSRGLGTCCLNWSKTAPLDKRMRKLVGISSREVIIMLVAVGHIPPKLEVARSTRKPLALASRHIRDRSETNAEEPPWF